MDAEADAIRKLRLNKTPNANRGTDTCITYEFKHASLPSVLKITELPDSLVLNKRATWQRSVASSPNAAHGLHPKGGVRLAPTSRNTIKTYWPGLELVVYGKEWQSFFGSCNAKITKQV